MSRLPISGIAVTVWLLLCSVAHSQSVDEPGRAAFAAGDYTTALSVWLPLAEAGDSHAQFNIGLLHDEGLGTPPSVDEARKWWNLAADQGLAVAHHNLALLELELASADPAAGDPGTAIRHLELAAETGHLPSRYTLGKLFELGLGVEANPEISAGHILTAAQGGFPAAQYNMGKRFRDGSGVAANNELAAEWFRRAALGGHAGSQDHYARRLKDGIGVTPDLVTAMAMTILAARGGYAGATELANELKGPLSIAELDRAFAQANAFTPEIVTGPIQ